MKEAFGSEHRFEGEAPEDSHDQKDKKSGSAGEINRLLPPDFDFSELKGEIGGRISSRRKKRPSQEAVARPEERMLRTPFFHRQEKEPNENEKGKEEGE